MAQPDGVKKTADVIAESKKVLASADKFQKEAGGPMAKADKPAEAAKPAAKKAPSAGILGEASDAAAGIKSRADNIKEYTNAVAKSAPKMHDGGEVMEDGIKNLQKGEVVIPKEKAKEGKEIMKLSKKAKGPMGDAIEEEEAEKETPKEEKKEGKKGEAKEKKAESKKEDKKEDKPKPHKYHRAEHEFHANGSITTKLHHKPGKPSADGKVEMTPEPTSFASPDFASMQSAMQQHVGGGPEGMPEEGSPEGGAPQQ